MPKKPQHGFTLIEMLVTISIIGILVGILLPSLKMARERAGKVACLSNLKQVGLALESYRSEYALHNPSARYMPQPFISGDDDPPLTQLLAPYLSGETDTGKRVFHCPGDRDHVFKISGTSYMYQSELSGTRFEDFLPVKFMNVPISDVVVCRDFDGGTFDVTSGTVVVPFFHERRNLLFGDGHAGNFE